MSESAPATDLMSYPVELNAPDIEPYRNGNMGVPYFTRFDSGRLGPRVLVTALTHGNELCGAVALDHLFRNGIRPVTGTLTLGFCNVAAYGEFDPKYPAMSRYVDEDFNRVWDERVLDGRKNSVERTRARDIRPILDETDLLLDIHSMQHVTAPLMLAGRHAKGRDLALMTGVPATVVMDAGHAAGRRMRDYSFFDDPADPRTALLVECGQHWSSLAGDVAIDVTYRFLHAVGLIDRETLEQFGGTAEPPPQQVIEITDAITVKSESFHFHRNFLGMEVIPEKGTEIGRDGDQPVVTPYENCVLIMPSRRLAPGLTAVRLGRFLV